VEEIQQAAKEDAKAGTTHAGGTVLNTISLTDDVADRVPLGIVQGVGQASSQVVRGSFSCSSATPGAAQSPECAFSSVFSG